MYKPDTKLFYSRMVYKLESGKPAEDVHTQTDKEKKTAKEMLEKKYKSKDAIDASIKTINETFDKVLKRFNFPERFASKAEKIKVSIASLASYKSKIDGKNTEADVKKATEDFTKELEKFTDAMVKLDEYDKAFKTIYDALENRYDSEINKLNVKCYRAANKENVSPEEVKKVVRAYLLRWHIAYFTDLSKLDDEKILGLSEQVGQGGKLNLGNMDSDLSDIEKQLDTVTRWWSMTDNKKEWYRRVYKNKDWDKDTETLHYPKGYGYKEGGYSEVKTPDWGGSPDKIVSNLAQDIVEQDKKEGEKNEKLLCVPAIMTRKSMLDQFKGLLGANVSDQEVMNQVKTLVPNAEDRMKKIGVRPFADMLKDWPDDKQKVVNVPAIMEEFNIFSEALAALANKNEAKELNETDKIEAVRVHKKGNKLVVEIKGKKGDKEKTFIKEMDLTFAKSFNMTYGTSNLAEQVKEIENKLLLLNIIPPEVYEKIPNLPGMVQTVLDKAKPKIVITGKASFDGNYEGNVRLANSRAETIISKLKAKGYKGFKIEKKTMVVSPITFQNLDKKDIDNAWNQLLDLRRPLKPDSLNLTIAQLKAEMDQYTKGTLKDTVLKAWYDTYIGNQRGVGVEITPTEPNFDFTIKNERATVAAATPAAAPGGKSSTPDIPPASWAASKRKTV